MSTSDSEQDPAREAEAGECNAAASETERPPGADDGKPQEAQFQARTEVDEAFVPESILVGTSPVDGLPVPQDDMALALAPDFTYESMICVGDERTFVEVFVSPKVKEDPNISSIPQAASSLATHVILFFPRAPQYRVLVRNEYDADGKRTTPLEFPSSRVTKRFGHQMVDMTVDETLAHTGDPGPGPDRMVCCVLVMPVRPACTNYARSIFSNDDAPGTQIIFRNCLARRSVGGALMSLRDEAVFACELRNPPHPASVERYVGARDREILNRSAPAEKVSLFNIRQKPSGEAS